MNHALDCTDARALLSARLDSELAGGDAPAALATHLAGCAACRAHDVALARLARGFDALRAAERPLADLMPALEARLAARARPVRRLRLARAAAALAGFAAVATGALLVERGAPDGARPRHARERLAAGHAAPRELFAALPEYRLLRLAPTLEDGR